MARARIVFMGTPGFAVPTLEALATAHDVVAVVTAPDRPAGRGRQLRASEVKRKAIELGLPVLQPERLRDPDFLAELDRLHASIYVVVAFRMLPESVWSKPVLGTINLHASLLPRYRGAAPINWAIINGDTRSGLTTFLIRHDIDTGDVLLQEAMDIGAEETAGELHDRMMVTGATLALRTVDGLLRGELKPVTQGSADDAPAAPKLRPDNCRLTLDRSTRSAHDLVRGLSPYPGAWCQLLIGELAPMHFKVLRTHIDATYDDHDVPGTLRMAGERLYARFNDGWLELLEVQAEGKRRITAGEFIRGFAGASRSPLMMKLA